MSRLTAHPRSAVVAVTLGCNSKCKTCDIWMVKPENELQPEDYRRLPRSLKNINVSGGEPFLRDDLPDIVRIMRQTTSSPRIVISTNAILPERTEKIMRQIPDAAVRVSIDGIGEAHDSIRGVPGNFERCLETLRRLKAIGVTDLGLSATASSYNPGEVPRVQALARSLGIEFVVGVAHSSPSYFGDQVSAAPDPERAARELVAIRDRELSAWRPKQWVRAWFTDGLIDQLEGRARRMPCYAIESHFYLDPHGNVYPCNARGDVMGNLRTETYEEIVARNGALLEDVRRCNDCWMSCTVTPGLRERPWTPLAWVIRAKLAGAPARLPLESRVEPHPLGTGQGTIPIYLDERGKQRYGKLKGQETPAPGAAGPLAATPAAAAHPHPGGSGS
jgi:MoaA/NifB/PqqE/SkfB family radical SAM enzyme